MWTSPTRKESALSTPGGSGQLASRMGIQSGFLVLERGFGDDSDEAITEPKLVSDWILNRMDIKTYVPNLEKIESLFSTKRLALVNGLSLDELKEVEFKKDINLLSFL